MDRPSTYAARTAPVFPAVGGSAGRSTANARARNTRLTYC